MTILDTMSKIQLFMCSFNLSVLNLFSTVLIPDSFIHVLISVLNSFVHSFMYYSSLC